MANRLRQKPLIVGIIGGMGPAATCLLFERIVRATPAVRDQDHLHIIVNNDASIPDRTAAVLGEGPSPGPTLARTAQVLARAGAELLVMPCVTAHLFLREIRAAVDLPMLDVVAEISRELRDSHPHASRVGVLCTDGSRQGNVFGPLEAQWELVWPGARGQARFMDAVYGPSGVKTAGATPQACGAMAELVDLLLADGAQVVIAGCTEAAIGLVEVGGGRPVVDAVDVLSRAAVREAMFGRALPAGARYKEVNGDAAHRRTR